MGFSLNLVQPNPTERRSGVSLRTRRKSVDSDQDVQRVLLEGARLWANTQTWIQVGWQGRVIGQVKGDPARRRSLWTTQIQPFADQDTLVAKLSAGQYWGQLFWKPVATNIVIGNWYDAWGTQGNPQEGLWNGTALTARQMTTSTTGAMYTGGAVSPLKKYLVRASFFNGETTRVARILYDRVLEYDACLMSASSQNMTNTLAATRYISTGDPGLQIYIEADTVHNATAGNLTTLTYKNVAGSSNTVPTTPTLSLIPSLAAPTATLGARGSIASPGGTITGLSAAFLTLASGDSGVQSITNFQFSAAPTGTNAFVLMHPLLLLPDCVSAAQSSDYTCTDGLESTLKQIFDDACLSYLYMPLVSAQPAITHGQLQFGWH